MDYQLNTIIENAKSFPKQDKLRIWRFDDLLVLCTLYA